jgi:hypothetical protein
MLERFLSQPVAISREDVDWLLDKIDQLSVPAGLDLELTETTAHAA